MEASTRTLKVTPIPSHRLFGLFKLLEQFLESLQLTLDDVMTMMMMHVHLAPIQQKARRWT